ncbi:hypothetical protein ACROYT_G016675 [Oculina patagonica]
MEDSWRQFQLENEDEAMKRALELSRIEHQKSQAESQKHRHEPRRDETLSSTVSLGHQSKQQDREDTQLLRSAPGGYTNYSKFPQERSKSKGTVTTNTRDARAKAIPLCLPNNCKWNPKTCQYIQTKEERSSLYVVEEALEQLRKVKGTVTTNTRDARAKAIPLCLPNNCKWNPKTCQYIQTKEERSSLYVVEEALEQLRKVKGPVCVVSVTGPYRKGKSYILSEAFNQPEVFPLGHEMVAETMGIWYMGVPTRRDLEGLDFIVKLSQRIQIRSKGSRRRNVGTKETEFFHRTFPFFIWLLRDVTQSIPPDCKDIKDYFLKKVFREQESQNATGHQSQKAEVAESILRFFPGFDAFTLPLPTADSEVMKSLSKNKLQLQAQFLSKLEDFKCLLKSTLVPKHSCTDGEFVTGEGLAALVALYVNAINTPGAIPNVQSAWDTFVQTKCLDAKQASIEAYKKLMTSLLSEKRPRDNDEIHKCHNTALQESEVLFMSETTGISTNTVEKYTRELKNQLNKHLKQWQTENVRLTKQSCDDLLLQLKRKHLDLVLQQLQLSVDDIIGVYHLINEEYNAREVGAEDAIAAAFFDFHPELAKETKRYLKLKNYDEKAAKDMAEEAYRERKRRRLEMEMLIARLEKENEGMREKMADELKVQREQLQNMLAASMKKAEQEREAFIKENHELEERFLEMQKSNEDNMRTIKNIFELITKYEEEKLKLRMQMRELPEDEMKASLKKMNDRHSEEVTAMLEKLDIQLDGIKKIKESGDDEALYSTKKEKGRAADWEELPQMMTSRAQMVGSLQQNMADTEKEREAVDKPSFLKQGLKVIAQKVPVVGEAIALYPPAKPYAEPVAAVVGAFAKALSECDDCSIM